MKYKELSKLNNHELQAYRLLGVNKFQKLVLTIEKLKYRKVNGQNVNYHPDGMSVFSLERFESFVIYNAFLHSVSLLFAFLCLILSIFNGSHSAAFYLVLALLFVINLYCIMLQRMNYLRMRKRFNRYYKRVLGSPDICKKEAMRELYLSKPEKMTEDYEVLSRIKKALDGECDCFLTSDDKESLERLAAFVSHKSVKTFRRKDEDSGKKELTNTVRPYSALQRRASRIQRGLRIPGRTAFDPPAIITETLECEELYKKLIPSDSSYDFSLIRFTLYEAFANLIEEMKR